MKLLLTKAARINFKAGEIVEVSPEQASFLLSIGAAEIVFEPQRVTPEDAAPKKTVRKAAKK